MEKPEGQGQPEINGGSNAIKAIAFTVAMALLKAGILGCSSAKPVDTSSPEWSGGVSPEAQKRERQKAIDAIMQNCKDEATLGIKKVKKFRKTTMDQEMPINEIENTRKSFVGACLRRHNLQRSPFMINDIR